MGHTRCRGSLQLYHDCAPLDVIQLLVEHWPEAVEEKDSRYRLPLHLTCSHAVCRVNALLEVIQLLMEKVASINKQSGH
jgi:hypothetical protein